MQSNLQETLDRAFEKAAKQARKSRKQQEDEWAMQLFAPEQEEK